MIRTDPEVGWFFIKKVERRMGQGVFSFVALAL
jgi:hypothetical protein